MTPQEKAKELVKRFFTQEIKYHNNINTAKEFALIAVNEIVRANPHSNPFNTKGFSTMAYWIEVEYEIKKI